LIPAEMNESSVMLWASVLTAILIPRSLASLACSSERSSRSGLELISKRHPFAGVVDNPFDVELITFALEQQPAGGMAQNCCERGRVASKVVATNALLTGMDGELGAC
jgi:hypothetical protein